MPVTKFLDFFQKCFLQLLVNFSGRARGFFKRRSIVSGGLSSQRHPVRSARCAIVSRHVQLKHASVSSRQTLTVSQVRERSRAANLVVFVVVRALSAGSYQIYGGHYTGENRGACGTSGGAARRKVKRNDGNPENSNTS